MLKLNFVDLNEELLYCVKEISDILKIELSDNGFCVETKPVSSGISLNFYEQKAVIEYSNKAEFFRAVGLLAEEFSAKNNIIETARYKELCVMYDNSRNAVMTVDTVKKAIRHLALMGYTSLMLYTEDTYEIKEYPYFGYMRGRFTCEELRDIDNYAYSFGIEVIPCIQVLAHLAQALRWPCFAAVNDWDDILLVGEPKTYELIRAMISTVRSCFRSKRLHIGMDEARMVGNGKYFNKNGYRDRWDILSEHMDKVVKICKEYDFKPIMWSDMYFSAAFDRNHYYYAASLENPHIPERIINAVPEEMEIVYWDYGNSLGTYRTMARLHKEFKNPIWFAGGATKWAGYAPMNQFSIKTGKDALLACGENEIDKIIVTAWGDNGAECSNMSILPTLQMYAECCYRNDCSDEHLSKRFQTCVDGDYADFMLLDSVNFTPGNPAPGCGSRNPTKYLLHQDLLMGLFDKHTELDTFAEHFRIKCKELTSAAERNPRWSYMFKMLAGICDVLELKCDVGIRIKAAYDKGDKEILNEICNTELSEMLNRLEEFIEVFRKGWLAENKIFGLEVIEIRLGGLERRIKTAKLRLNQYLNGEADCLPELEEERLAFDCNNNEGRNPNTAVNMWGKTVSGSLVDHI